MYKGELCNGQISTFIENPYKAGDKIYLAFDTTHICKCIYNVFLKRNEFKCPSMGIFEEMNPVFQHLIKLYQMEIGKHVKLAHKLNDYNLASTPIERCNVKLADSIFHESTINALTFYSDKFPEFKSTAVLESS